jgi:hypothetical protein
VRRFCFNGILFRLGKILRSGVVGETDLVLFFQQEKCRAQLVLDCAKMQTMNSVFGNDRSAYVLKDVMFRRSEDMRRPRESPVAFGLLGRVGRAGVASAESQFWTYSKLWKESGLVGLPWNTYVWRCDVAPEEGEEEQAEAADADADVQDQPLQAHQLQALQGTGPNIKYGYASWRPGSRLTCFDVVHSCQAKDAFQGNKLVAGDLCRPHGREQAFHVDR